MRAMTVALLILVAGFQAAATIGLWGSVEAFLYSGYQREPQFLLVTLAAGGLLPLAALMAVAAARSWQRRHEVALAEGLMGEPVSRRQVTEVRGEAPLLDVVGDAAHCHALDANMIRIGRHEENDIQLLSPTVHRYHAIVHRTPERSYIITDLSGPAGNGVFVNSERVDHAGLAAGDLIELGDVRLRFRFGEAQTGARH
jgi:FHA domain